MDKQLQINTSQLPPLTGNYWSTAIQAREAYITYICTYKFATNKISWVDVQIQIELIEEQLGIKLTDEQFDYLVDKFYEYFVNQLGYLKRGCIKVITFPLFKFTTTDKWKDLQHEAQYFDLVMRCLAYSFKTSPLIKPYLLSLKKGGNADE